VKIMKEIRSVCPSCNSTKWNNFLTTKDFSVTGEEFELKKCLQCTLVFTQPIPTEDAISPYYNFADYISHTNTKRGLFHKLYHTVRRFTLQQKLSWIKYNTKLNQGKLLDIGCGVGSFLQYAKYKGWQVTGIEPDATARKNAAEINNIIAFTAEQLFSLEDKYDAITMWHVLEHVHQLKAYLAQIKNILSSDGIFVIAVPNYTSFDATYYKSFWAAYDVPRHLYHFSPTSIQHLANQFDLEIVAYKPMWFDSVYVSLLSEQYKSGYMLRGILVGIWSNLKGLFNRKKCSSITYILKHRH
jgi:2-polyprenyl-3-methyl-5-hydroxy-6-metoxy-1,4-benzoquinol methylase